MPKAVTSDILERLQDVTFPERLQDVTYQECLTLLLVSNVTNESRFTSQHFLIK